MKRKNTILNQYNYHNFNLSFLLIAIALIIMLSIVSYSEITNSGFETWTNGNPDSWSTTNSPPSFVNVTQTIDAHSGSFACQGEVKSESGIPITAAVLSGADGIGFSENSRPEALHGWYKFTSNSEDILQVLITFSKSSEGLGAGQFFTSTSTGNWTEFVANILWGNADIPDKVNIAFQILSQTGMPHEGSLFIIDDLAYGQAAPNAIENENSALNSVVSLLGNFPNPYSRTTTIKYNLNQQENVSIEVYDLLGQVVSSSTYKNQSPGNYEFNFDATKLTEGKYFYKLQAGTSTVIKEMDVVK